MTTVNLPISTSAVEIGPKFLIISRVVMTKSVLCKNNIFPSSPQKQAKFKFIFLGLHSARSCINIKTENGRTPVLRKINNQECCSESENIFLPLQRRSNLASKYGSVFTRSSSENLTVFFRIRGFGQHSFSFVYQAVAVSCSSVCTFIRRLCTYRCGVRSFILIRVLSEPSDE